jgi:hypothetical protein
VINAGDGTHEHPTQALLDAADDPPAQTAAMTSARPSVAICGDIASIQPGGALQPAAASGAMQAAESV